MSDMIRSMVRKTTPAEVWRMQGTWGKTKALATNPKEGDGNVPWKGAMRMGKSGRDDLGLRCVVSGTW